MQHIIKYYKSPFYTFRSLINVTNNLTYIVHHKVDIQYYVRDVVTIIVFRCYSMHRMYYAKKFSGEDIKLLLNTITICVCTTWVCLGAEFSKNCNIACMMLGFRRGVNKIIVLLGCYAALICSKRSFGTT
jgi:hypothetical protein